MSDGESSDCRNMNFCTFFQMYGRDEKYKAAVSGFVRLYCRGPKQDACARKRVSTEVGGPHKVPSNMLPTGLPLFGTNDSDWSETVRKVSRRNQS